MQISKGISRDPAIAFYDGYRGRDPAIALGGGDWGGGGEGGNQ